MAYRPGLEITLLTRHLRGNYGWVKDAKQQKRPLSAAAAPSFYEICLANGAINLRGTTEWMARNYDHESKRTSSKQRRNERLEIVPISDIATATLLIYRGCR